MTTLLLFLMDVVARWEADRIRDPAVEAVVQDAPLPPELPGGEFGE